MKTLRHAARFLVVFGVLAFVTTASRAAAPPRYAYGSDAFTAFVADSYREAGAKNPSSFYRWMDAALRKQTGAKRGSWAALLARRQRQIARAPDAARRTRAERALCQSLHQTVKATIPRFSLERGFEFTNVVRRGERQCFLQSVLIAGLLQRAGVDAGVAMVYRNDRGQTTNNGHAVTVARLSDGTDVLVDASDPTPFVRHQGLFVAARDGESFRYVDPVYRASGPAIAAYQAAGGGNKIAPRALATLPLPFLRSQFAYYRGERAPGGVFARSTTPAGLQASARQLKISIARCPQNPLAVYMLGRVYQKLHDETAARQQFERAAGLYRRAGWLPGGAREALAQVRAAGSAGTSPPAKKAPGG